MADDSEYNRKLDSLQQYIPFLNNMIVQLKDPRKKNREQQLNKMMSLHSMITDKKKKLKLETLMKCEDVILKLYTKVKSGTPTAPVPPQTPSPSSRAAARNPSPPSSVPITPSSPSPPPNIPILIKKPVVIPTEKIAEVPRFCDDRPSEPVSSFKPRIDIYSRAAVTIDKSPPFEHKSRNTVFERLGHRPHDLSKPPISLEDLEEELRPDDRTSLNTDKMSLGELTDLRQKLQKQLSCDRNKSPPPSKSKAINPTVRNTILTKKDVNKSKHSTESETSKKLPKAESHPKKPVKIIQESASIFGSELSNIDKIITANIGKQRRTSLTLICGQKDGKSHSKTDDSHGRDKSSDKSTEHKRNEGHKSSSKDKHSHKKSEEEDKRKDNTKKTSEPDKVTDSTSNKDKAPVTYKRLADKYNPKPRKPSSESNTSDSSTHKTRDVPVPSVPSVVKPVGPLSPTSSTNSIDQEFSQSKFLPPSKLPDIDILSNPITKAIIETVVNQFKTGGALSGVPQNNPQPIHPWKDQGPSTSYNRSFTPIPHHIEHGARHNENQFTPSRRSSTPNPYTRRSPPRSYNNNYEEDNDFSQRNRGNNNNNVWRRDVSWSSRDPRPSNVGGRREDPRINRSRDYERRPYNYDSRNPDRRSFDRDERLKQNDPRLNKGNRDHDEQQRQKCRLDYTDDSFASPLNSLYVADGERKTGKGYGVQNYKIPRVKKEPETPDDYKTDELNESKLNVDLEALEDDDQNKISPVAAEEHSVKEPEPQVSEATKVTSTTECSSTTPTAPPSHVDTNEISSTNTDVPSREVEVSGQTKDGSAPKDTDIINQFLKKLLENEQTRSAASMLINNLSSSAKDDDSLKQIVKTVKDVTEKSDEKEEPAKKSPKKQKSLSLQAKSTLLARKRAMRKRMIMQRRKAMARKQALSRKMEEETPSAIPQEPVIVSVGERIKSRKRVASAAVKRKTRPSELDLLHGDIQEMFIRDGVLTATGKRMCCLLKDDNKEDEPSGRKTRAAAKAKTSPQAAKKLEEAERLKVMSNVRVLLPKMSIQKMKKMDEDGKRYSLRRSLASKSYAEDSDEEKASKGSKTKQTKEVKEPPKCSSPEETPSDDEANDDKEDIEVESSPVAKTVKRGPRKRSHIWASGVLPKTKRRKINTAKEGDGKKNKGDDESKLLDLIEPDKTYYSWKPWHFRVTCKLCSYFGMNITQHYVITHPDSEVLIARLEPSKAKLAIQHAVHKKLDTNGPETLISNKQYSFKCRFCDFDMKSKVSNFVDHVSNHTGEYRYRCDRCHYAASNHKTVKKHMISSHAAQYENKPMRMLTEVFAYMCLECNYVQFDKKAVESHVNIYHLGEGEKIIRINCSSVPLGEPTTIKKNKKGSKHVEEEEGEEEEEDSVSENSPKKTRLDAEAEEENDEGEESEDQEAKKPKLDLDKGVKAIEKDQHESDESDQESKKPKDKADEKERGQIDMTVFTGNSDTLEDDAKIEQERLNKMNELNDSVKVNRLKTLNFVDQLSTRLQQEETQQEVVKVKTEPIDSDQEESVALPEEDDPLALATTARKPTMSAIPQASIQAAVPPPKENIIMQNIVKKLQGHLSDGPREKETPQEPPPLTPLDRFKDDDSKKIVSAGFMDVFRSCDDDSIVYVCRLPSCLHYSRSRDLFLKHWSEGHPRTNNYSATKCRLCLTEIKGSELLIRFFQHVEDNHMNKIVLKPRRLSGDLLSEAAESPEDENPFPFKISGVVSLASCDAPPLAPIVRSPEKPPLVKPKKLESVILKEAKMTMTDREKLWKSKEVMEKFLKSPINLYKCPQFFCKFTTNTRQVFDGHVKAHAQASGDELVPCVYCDVKTPLTHCGLHIDLRHANCLFSCSKCLFRGLYKEYVMVHIKEKHASEGYVISLPPRQNKPVMMTNQRTLRLSEACVFYECGQFGCGKTFVSKCDFWQHLESHTGILTCGLSKGCSYKCIVIDEMCEHWTTHSCWNFHCLHCKFADDSMYPMLLHYTSVHPNLEIAVVDRRNSAGDTAQFSDQAFAAFKNGTPDVILSGIDARKFAVHSAVNLPIATSTNTAAVPEFLDISTTSQPPIPEPSPLIDDPLAIVDNASPSVDPLSSSSPPPPPAPPSSTPPEVEEDDETNDAHPISSFVGHQLYRCVCSMTFPDSKKFKSHLMLSKKCHDDNNPLKPFKCAHCRRNVKSHQGLLEHILYHGPLRFSCSVCMKKWPSVFSLRVHMRMKHSVYHTVITPLVPGKTDKEHDEFVLKPQISSAEITEAASENSSASTSSQPDGKSEFSPAEIDELPKRHIFNSVIKCSLCSFGTKVRTNLLRHLQLHSTDESFKVPSIAPVNPVPCLDKNEKMFDKMTNLALSSMASGNSAPSKPSQNDTSSIAPDDLTKYPGYVPANRRFACPGTGCSYLCPEDANLRHHLLALHHSEPELQCVHCDQTFPTTDVDPFIKHLKLHDLHLYKCSECPFIHNLRHKVDHHCSESHHEDTGARTVVIRALEPPVEVVQKMPELPPEPVPEVPHTRPWRCGMCKCRCATRSDIVNHITNKHDLDAQFKCTLCSYKSDDKETMNDHFKVTHLRDEVDIIHVYYFKKDEDAHSKDLFDTTPLWQRDRPRVRHIRGILFEETISAAPKQVKKISSPAFTRVSNAGTNLDESIDAVAKGPAGNSSARREDDVFAMLNQQINEAVVLSDEERDVILIEDEELIIPVDDADDDMDDLNASNDDLMIDMDVTESPFKVKLEEVNASDIGENDGRGLLTEDDLMKMFAQPCPPHGRGFRCPFCLKFRAKRAIHFVFHILTEMKCCRYKCKLCNFACLTFDQMTDHFKDSASHNTSTVDHDLVENLTIDNRILYWLQILIRHQAKIMVASSTPYRLEGQKEKSAECIWQCKYCHIWFKNLIVLNDHEISHWAVQEHNCSHCCSTFPTLNEIFQHTFLAHPNFEIAFTTKNGPYVGEVMNQLKSFTFVSTPPVNFTLSENEISAIIGTKADQPNEPSKSGQSLQQIEYYCCSHCHEKGDKAFLLEHHKANHPNLKFSMYQTICFECCRTFKNVKELRLHFNRVHAGKKLSYFVIENKPQGSDPLICTKCPFRSCNMAGMRTHIRKHIRPVDCKICGATFIYPTEGRAHHNKEHLHSAEAIEENAERIREYETLLKNAQVKAAIRKPSPERSQPARAPSRAGKMIARKSTGAPAVVKSRLVED